MDVFHTFPDKIFGVLLKNIRKHRLYRWHNYIALGANTSRQKFCSKQQEQLRQKVCTIGVIIPLTMKILFFCTFLNKEISSCQKNYFSCDQKYASRTKISSPDKRFLFVTIFACTNIIILVKTKFPVTRYSSCKRMKFFCFSIVIKTEYYVYDYCCISLDRN